MGISIEETNIIKTVLQHTEDGTTDMQPALMRNPVTTYTDPDVLAQEVNTLFRKFPIILGHAEQLPEPGSYFTNDDLGVPILVTRNNDGVVKAFMNVCRHRGARLAGEPCGKAKTFSCPYHKWTYDLNGALRGLPQAAGFGDIDKTALGLGELPAFERVGLVGVDRQEHDQLAEQPH